jgi:hypothetical protein
MTFGHAESHADDEEYDRNDEPSEGGPLRSHRELQAPTSSLGATRFSMEYTRPSANDYTPTPAAREDQMRFHLVFKILLLAALAPVSIASAQTTTPPKDATAAAPPAAAPPAAAPPAAAPPAAAAPAPAPAPAPVPEMTMKEVKQTLGMIVFPAKGQTPEVQEAEELACLQWSADQLGIKPGTPEPDAKAAGDAAAAQTDSLTRGAGVKGAAKGAAAGAIIGSISGNAGAGAAYGAAAGGIAGKRARKGASAQADAAAQQQVEAEQKAKVDNLKKAMTVCLESKGYTIK